MRPDETGTNHEINANKHDPPTPAEVRATLWKENQRLHRSVDYLRAEITYLRSMLTGIVNTYDDGDTKKMAAEVSAVERFLEQIK